MTLVKTVQYSVCVYVRHTSASWCCEIWHTMQLVTVQKELTSWLREYKQSVEQRDLKLWFIYLKVICELISNECVCLSVCVRQMLCLPHSTAPDSNSLPLVQLQQNSYQGQTHVKHWDWQTDLGQISESVGTHCDVTKISLMSHHLLNERLQHTQTYTLVYHDHVSQYQPVKYHLVSAIIIIKEASCLIDSPCVQPRAVPGSLVYRHAHDLTQPSPPPTSATSQSCCIPCWTWISLPHTSSPPSAVIPALYSSKQHTPPASEQTNVKYGNTFHVHKLQKIPVVTIGSL